jgi:hypothetical protein
VAHRGQPLTGLITTWPWLQTRCSLLRRIIMRPTAHLRDGTAQDGPGPNAPSGHLGDENDAGHRRTHHASEEGGHAHHRKCVRLISICPVNMVFEALAARITD